MRERLLAIPRGFAHVSIRRLLWILVLGLALAFGSVLTWRFVLHRAERPFLVVPVPDGAGLLTNAYATWHPTDTEARRMGGWMVTSGSLFYRDGSLWSGVPDDTKPNLRSTNGTGSGTFRIYSNASYGDVEIRFDLKNLGFAALPPIHAWDGFHVFLRVKDEYQLYVVSVNRRDHTASIKKKVPRGPSNGGTYDAIAKSAPLAFTPGKWQHVRVSAVTNKDNSVTLTLYVNGKPVVTGTDIGAGAGPLLDGKIGLRADNDQFELRNLALYDP